MAFIRAKFFEVIEKNLGHPKGFAGYLVMTYLKKTNAALEVIAVQNLNVQPNHHVLEVGFGPGVGLDVALEKVEHGSGKIYGLEISEQMVKSAKKRLYSATERDKLDVRLGSVMDLPYPEDYFDRVFHTSCYYFWPSLEQGVSELKRVMKPGGLMVSGVVCETSKAPETYLETLSQGGFTNVTTQATERNPSPLSWQLIFASKPLQE